MRDEVLLIVSIIRSRQRAGRSVSHDLRQDKGLIDQSVFLAARFSERKREENGNRY